MMNLAQLVDGELVRSGEIRRPRYNVAVRIFHYVITHRQATLTDIAAALELTPAHASTTLAVLMSAGYIERFGRGLYRVR